MNPTSLDLRTSCYGARRLIVASNRVPVRTSIGTPKWPLGFEIGGSCRLLMPRLDMLKLPRAEYEPRYYELLDKAGVESIARDLALISAGNGNRGLVLLCYEGAADIEAGSTFCHRRLFADWWERETGQPVPELAEPTRQTTLF